MVEIARALAQGARVVVFDEPTSSLGHADAERLLARIGQLKRQRCAVIYISHFIDEARRVSDRFAVLRDGRTVGGGPSATAAPADIVDLMVGRRLGELYPRRARARGERLLHVDGLGGAGKPIAASLDLHRGEVLGVAGLVGAGRTELLRAIFGLDRVVRGDVRVGTHAGPASPARRWAQGLGMASEDRKAEGLALGLDIADNLTMSRVAAMPALALLRPARQADAARAFIERLALRCRGPRQRVSELSGGNQQKVAIGRLLHHGVDVLLLDEPTRGIDVGSKAHIYRLIDEIVTRPERPGAVLLVSSHMPELLGVCDRIAVMCRGRLGRARPAAEWDEHHLMLEAAGEAA